MAPVPGEAGIRTPSNDRILTFALAGVILFSSGVVRYCAGRDGLWLDEIWTLGLARLVKSPWTILTGLHNENNHYFNTFCVWLLGAQSNWIAYRLPAMAAGTIAVALAGSIGRRRSDAAALLAMLMTGASYMLIHYSSEARGYSFAVCFALLCLDFHERVFRGAGWPAAAGSAVGAIAGVLSQPVFLAFYGALFIWSGWKTWMTRFDRTGLRRQWCLCHIPPLAFFGWLYAVDLHQVLNAGGPIDPLWDVILETLSLAGGGPDGNWRWAGACLVTLALAASLTTLWRYDRDWCVLVGLAVVVMPALLLVVTGRREVYPRYFLIPVVLIDLTFGLAVAAVWRQRRQTARKIAGLLIALSLVGNAVHVSRLLAQGRGGYFETLSYLSEHTPGEEIAVLSDHAFRNGMVLAYYSRYLPPAKQLDYCSQDPRPQIAQLIALVPRGDRFEYHPPGRWSARAPEWFLIHNLDRRFVPQRTIVLDGDRRYSLATFHPYAGLSGWCWALYHIDNRPLVE